MNIRRKLARWFYETPTAVLEHAPEAGASVTLMFYSENGGMPDGDIVSAGTWVNGEYVEMTVKPGHSRLPRLYRLLKRLGVL